MRCGVIETIRCSNTPVRSTNSVVVSHNLRSASGGGPGYEYQRLLGNNIAIRPDLLLSSIATGLYFETGYHIHKWQVRMFNRTMCSTELTDFSSRYEAYEKLGPPAGRTEGRIFDEVSFNDRLKLFSLFVFVVETRRVRRESEMRDCCGQNLMFKSPWVRPPAGWYPLPRTFRWDTVCEVLITAELLSVRYSKDNPTSIWRCATLPSGAC